MANNFISVSQLEEKGVTMVKEGKNMILAWNGKAVASVHCIG
jgi:hypothetical protein